MLAKIGCASMASPTLWVWSDGMVLKLDSENGHFRKGVLSDIYSRAAAGPKSESEIRVFCGNRGATTAVAVVRLNLIMKSI